MALWKSDHHDLNIPTDVTTWEWAFESQEYAPAIYDPNDTGFYENAVTKERLHYSQVKDNAELLSTTLVRHYGVQPGDTVSLFATNTVWYPVALWATIRAGARINGASPAYNVDEMTHALTTAHTKILFTMPGSLDNAIAAAEKAGLPKKNIFLLEDERPGFATIQQLIAASQNSPLVPTYHIPRGTSNREICGYLNFSSGTTGLPKAVMLSHHNIIAQCLQLRQLQVLDPGERFRHLAVTPVYHISGLVRYIHYPVLMNGYCFMLPAFTMELMLRSILEYRIRELILVPPIVIRLVRDPVVDKFYPELFKIVRRWSSGSAPTSPEVIELLRRRFPDTGFRQGYGATESSGCISCHPPTHYDYKYAMTGGKLVANTTVKVIDLNDSSKLLGPNKTGEICAKGPQIAMGYLDNANATAETFDGEGFLHTGDVGWLDEEGLVHVEDRIKEMIKVRGNQVAPAEREDVLQGHESVDDCAVIGIADTYSGEKPKAYVVLRHGIEPTERLARQLLEFIRAKVSSYKALVELEIIAEPLPKSPTGKLLRRVLKANDRESGRNRGVVARAESRSKL